MLRPVVVTGVGVVTAALVGGGDSLRRFLAAPSSHGHVVDDTTLAALMDGVDVRRTSRVSRLALAATRLALADARLDGVEAAGLVLGTETATAFDDRVRRRRSPQRPHRSRRSVSNP